MDYRMNKAAGKRLSSSAGLRAQLIRIFAGALLLAVASSGIAQVERFIAGTDYRELDAPLRTADSDKVEVIELFWYGCPGCYAFEPHLAAWEARQADSIDHKRLPAVWNSITRIHAQAYYTAEVLGVLDAVHNPFFDQFHVQRNMLQNEIVIRDFFESCGISQQDFDRVFNSFAVRTRLNQGETQMRNYGDPETPSIYVNGKYVVTLGPRGFQHMLDVVDYLVSIEQG